MRQGDRAFCVRSAIQCAAIREQGTVRRLSPPRSRLVLFFAAAIPVLAALAPRDLWSPDEPRYGRIAYDMHRGGDWVVTRWNDEWDAEKPPFGYWIMAAGGFLTGEVTPVTARLGCALFAALAVLLTAGLARRWFGDAALGDTAALLFSTSGLVLWNSSRAGLDLPMTAFSLLSTLGAVQCVVRPAVGPALLAGVAAGLGVLVKGPHALYVPVTAAVGAALATGAWRRLLDPRWLLALGALLVVVAAWLVPALLLGEPGYRDRLLGQLVTRVQGRHEPHRHAFPYLMGMVLACGLPWTPVWVAGLGLAVRPRRRPEGDRVGLGAAAGGALGALLLLSLAVSKRDVYVIMLLPMLAILGAYAIHHEGPERLRRWTAVWFGLVLLGIALVCAGAPAFARLFWKPDAWQDTSGAAFAQGFLPFLFGALAVAAAAGAIATFRRRDRIGAAARTSGVVLGAVWVAAAVGVTPSIEPSKTWNAAVPLLRSTAAGQQVVMLGFSDGALVWALRPENTRHVSSEPHDVAARLRELAGEAPPARAVVLETKTWRIVQEHAPDVAALWRTLWGRRVGMKVYTVLTPAGP
jgi:4-amino-4-deoxy-L-arabinose transferase-like glycosyltransferase